MVYGLDTQALNNIWPSFTRFCRTIIVRIRPETKIGRSPFLLFIIEVIFVLSNLTSNRKYISVQTHVFKTHLQSHRIVHLKCFIEAGC